MVAPRFNAHRGLQPFGPENSIASFEAAAQHRVWAIETDFRLTRDSQVVCIHDATLDRTTDGTGKVRDHTLAEVRGFRVRPVNTKTVRRQYDYEALSDREKMIPTMDEYFGICRKGGCVAFVELKEDGGVIALMNEAIRRHKMTGRCVISSSNRALLRAYRESGGKELIHLIFGKIEDLDLLLELGNAAGPRDGDPSRTPWTKNRLAQRASRLLPFAWPEDLFPCRRYAGGPRKVPCPRHRLSSDQQPVVGHPIRR